MQNFKFEILYQSSRSSARVGRIHTPHGVIDTPGFVAVGTNATIKSLDSKMVSDIGLQLMFCNTYHLLIQPGAEVIQSLGGLHRFMNRNMPIITDSGGFQVFSLAYGGVANELKSRGLKSSSNSVISITEEGVLFRSYRDGKRLLLTPETSVQAQKDLGADIIIPFDELPPYHIDLQALQTSFDRTHRWESRSLDQHKKAVNQQAMYAVVHGGVNHALRVKSCDILSRQSFDGFAIGGSLGATKTEMFDILATVDPRLPRDKPRHLLGIGDLQSLRRSIAHGIDTFDSSYPTRAARHGTLFARAGGIIKISGPGHILRESSPDSDCDCYTCQHYSAAYLHHLFKAKEATGPLLATIHNLNFMVFHMQQYRRMILDGIL